MIKRSIVLSLLFIGLTNAMEQRNIGALQGSFLPESTESENLEEMKLLLEYILSDDIKSKTAEEILLDKMEDGLGIEEVFGHYLKPTKIKLPSVKIPYIGREEHKPDARKPFLLQTAQEIAKLEQRERVEQEARKRKAIVLEEDTISRPIDVFYVDDEDAETPSLQDNNTRLANNTHDTIKKVSVGLVKAKATKKRKNRKKAAPFSSDEEYEVASDVDSEDHDTANNSNVVEQKSSQPSRFSSRLAAKRKKLNEKEKLPIEVIFSDEDERSYSDYNDSEDSYDSQEEEGVFVINESDEAEELSVDEKQHDDLEIKKSKRKKKQFPCNECTKVFKRSSNLRKHEKHVHKHGEIVTCDECDYITRNPDALKRHKDQVHKHGTSLFCDNCKYTTINPSAMKRHEASNHNLMLTCIPCNDDTIYCSKGELTQHILENHPHESICKCGYESTKPGVMRIHKQSPHDLNLKCGGCDKYFVSKGARDQHARVKGHSRRKLAAKRQREK